MNHYFRKSILPILALALLIFLCPQFADAEGAYVVKTYNEQNGLPTGEANDVLQTSDGYLWIGSYGGLIRYDGSEFRNFSMEKAIDSSSIRALYEDSFGRLWIGTNDVGVYCYENGTFTKYESTKENSFLCIRDFQENNSGQIYCASNSGLALVDDGKLIPIDDSRINDMTVYTLASDCYHRVWGTLGTGDCFVLSGNDITILSSLLFSEEFDLYSVATVGKTVYLGTSGNQLIQLTLRNQSLTKDDLDIQILDTGEISTHNRLQVAAGGSILICGLHGFGALSSNGSLQTFGEKENAVSVNSATYDYEGNYWLASSAYGIVKYTLGCFDTINGLAAGLSDITVNTVTMQDGSLYVGHDGGLMIYDSEWNPVTNELTEMTAGVRVRHILADSKGNVWIASYCDNAVICYDTATEEATIYNTNNGLPVNKARVLYEMSDGTIVVGTSEGLALIREGTIIATYGSSEGLTTLQILSLCETTDGTLLAGSDGDGIYEIREGQVFCHAFDSGLEEGVVLRIMCDTTTPGAYFVSAGSNLYYFKDSHFTKLTNLEKSPGSIFDFYDTGNDLWILQNNGLFSVDKASLLAGAPVSGTTHGFSHGLTGSLNANTWHYIAKDGTIYLATRSGITTFDFQSTDHKLPVIQITSLTADGQTTEQPKEITVSGTTNRITIHFAALSYTDTTDIGISYQLKGFDASETFLYDQKSGEASYTNLPGGKYVFEITIFNPNNPNECSKTMLTIVKEKRFYEHPFFIPLVFVLLIALTALTVMALIRRKMARIKARQNELRSLVEQSLEAFARTIDAKDRYTNGHSMRVAAYSRELARRMSLPEEQQENIYYIALLHDIGKIGIPDEILNKPTKLTPEEFAKIKTHPAIGGEILKSFTALEGSAQGAKYHHERYDGTGYCEQLAGTDIPLVARIIGIADAYDAMSSNRCYRNALTSEQIESELRNGSGTQFDPAIVPYMLAMIDDGTAPIAHDESHSLPKFE